MKKLIILLVLLYQTFGLYAQQSEYAFLDAYAEKGEQEFFYRSTRVSSGSHIYVAGASINDDGDYDMLLAKYSGTTEIWSVVWDGGVEGDDYAADVIVDGSGNIIICGTSEVSATNYNAVVVKYNSSGTLQWASSFAGGANLYDGFVSLERDNSNNIYACGATQLPQNLAII